MASQKKLENKTIEELETDVSKLKKDLEKTETMLEQRKEEKLLKDSRNLLAKFKEMVKDDNADMEAVGKFLENAIATTQPAVKATDKASNEDLKKSEEKTDAKSEAKAEGKPNQSIATAQDKKPEAVKAENKSANNGFPQGINLH